MSNPYEPPPDKRKPKQPWLTPQFVLEFMLGCVIGFFVLFFAVVLLVCGMDVHVFDIAVE